MVTCRFIHFASKKVATFSTSVVKELHLRISGSKVATFRYKCSKGSTLWQLRLESRNFSVQVWHRKYNLAAPARKLQLFSTSVVKEVHFGSSGSQVATFQYKCSKGSTLGQLRRARLNFSVHVVKEVHFGSSGSKVATFQYKCSKGSALWKLRLESTLWQIRLESRNFSLH